MSTRLAHNLLRNTPIVLTALLFALCGLGGMETAHAAPASPNAAVGRAAVAESTTDATLRAAKAWSANRSGGDDSGPGSSSGSETEVEGFLLSAPIDLVGVWILESTPGITHTVFATTTTEFRDFGSTPPAPGQWIEAKGTTQPDGALLATRIDLDDFEDGQVVVRLAPGVEACEVRG